MPPFPELHGVDFRPFTGSSDYPHLVRIINAWARAARAPIAWRGSRVTFGSSGGTYRKPL